MRQRYAAAALVALALGLAGCGGDDSSAEPTAGDTTSATPSAATSSATPTESASATTSTPTATTSAAGGGDAPTPALAPLAWEDTGVSSKETVTKGGPWTMTVDEEGSLARLTGPQPATVSGDKRFKVHDVLLESDSTGNGQAVVVLTDTLEQLPARAVIIDLTSGTRSALNGRSDVPPATGGSWALDGTTLAYPTVRPDGSYCLATADLEGSEPSIVWCAEKRHGFNNVAITSSGIALMTFDDSRPSCRTLGTLDEAGSFQPVGGPTQCKGWELVPFESAHVWSEVPNEHQIDAGHVFAMTADSTVDLGPETSGSLTSCGGAAYWVRDPQGADEPARLMRYTDAGVFEIVYESKSTGNAFLSAPRCGGDRITVTSFGESGDEQVSAPVA